MNKNGTASSNKRSCITKERKLNISGISFAKSSINARFTCKIQLKWGWPKIRNWGWEISKSLNYGLIETYAAIAGYALKTNRGQIETIKDVDWEVAFRHR